MSLSELLRGEDIRDDDGGSGGGCGCSLVLPEFRVLVVGEGGEEGLVGPELFQLVPLLAVWVMLAVMAASERLLVVAALQQYLLCLYYWRSVDFQCNESALRSRSRNATPPTPILSYVTYYRK